MKNDKKFLIKRNSFQRMSIYTPLNQAEEYVSFISPILKKQQEKMYKKMHVDFDSLNSNKRLDDEEIILQDEYLTDKYSNEIYNIERIFPEIQWNTQFIFAISLFEEAMNNVCKFSKIHTTLNVTCKDFHGTGTGRCKIYLSKIHNINNIFSENLWSEIQKYKRIRNIMVHANGDLSEQSKENIKPVKYLCKKHDFFSVELYQNKLSVDDENFNNGKIKINEEFVILVINNLRKFLYQLCDQEVVSSN